MSDEVRVVYSTTTINSITQQMLNSATKSGAVFNPRDHLLVLEDFRRGVIDAQKLTPETRLEFLRNWQAIITAKYRLN